MSDREILLRLEGAGEKYCGECESRHVVPASGGVRRCVLFDSFILGVLRAPACLAAERAADALREDAKYRKRWERLRKWVGAKWMNAEDIRPLDVDVEMDRLEEG